jgi:hypothetical protein
MADRIRVQVLADGRVKIITDEISAANHTSADKLLKSIESELGGETTTERRKGARLTEAEHEHFHKHGISH